MATTGRWLAAIAAGLVVLVVCVVVAAFALPWDTATNVATGGAAGVIVGAFLPVWVASLNERAGGHAHEASEDRDAESAGALRQRASTGSVLISQAGRIRIRNQIVTNLTATPPAPQPPTAVPPGDAVVPPKD